MLESSKGLDRLRDNREEGENLRSLGSLKRGNDTSGQKGRVRRSHVRTDTADENPGKSGEAGGWPGSR